MKRAAANDLDDLSDDLFFYSNKQELTFSAVSTIDDLPAYHPPSSDDSSSDDDSDVELTKKDLVQNIKTTKQNNYLINASKIKLIPEILSPPPPPVTPGDSKKRCTRKQKRAAVRAMAENDTISLLKNKLNSSDTSLHHEDDICMIEEEVSVMQLKIRVHGVVEKYQVEKSDQLKKLIATIAKKEDVVPGHVTLNCGNSSIDPEHTINSLGLTVADIVECVIHAEEVERENRINIKIQSADKSHVYDVTLSETVQRVLKDFSEKCEVDITKIQFSFDGERIDDFKTTFSKLDIIDGDVIDADLQS